MEQKKKKSISKIGYITVLLAITIGLLTVYSGALRNDLQEEVQSTLREVSSQNVLIIQKEIEGDLNALIEIAERIGESEQSSKEEITNMLCRIINRYSFIRMGVCGTDGIAYTTDNAVIDISDRDYFKEAMTGERSISDPLTGIVKGEKIIVFCAPILHEGEVAGCVFASYSVDSLKQILSVSSFDGEGYTYIVQSDGSKVVDSAHVTSFQNMTNVLVSMEQADEGNKEAAETLRQLLKEGKSGNIFFHNEVDKYMYCTPLNISDWYLLDIVPVNVMETRTNYIMSRTYIICFILIVVYTLFVVWIYKEDYKKKKQMQELLYVDDLTGGNTYAKFKEEVAKRLKYTHEKWAFIMLDIDDFKLINELFGYEEGDKVICYIWNLLKGSCEDDESASRRIADSFTLFWNYEKKEEIEERVKKLIERIQHYSVRKETEYILQPNFGIYYVEKTSEDVEDMLNSATLAHNIAKGERESLFAVYSNEIKENMLQKKQLSDQMEHAYRHHHFEVYYQPKYDAVTKKLAGAEALVRWRKSDGSMVSPGVFIPLAEETGFVCKLDKYVFREVCLAQKRWMDKGIPIVPVSVNLSRKHLDNPEFINEYKAILEETQVPIECVQLEVTESAVFEKQGEFIKLVERLHELGFVILMDDFGTGYSSLMMLKQIPIDVMKLDKSFVDDYNDVRGEQIIRCVMQMAQNLNIEITAEGVETEEQYIFLKGIGCDTIQGYYFARPMPEQDYEQCMTKCQL